MKLSELRPCDSCGGKITPQFYVIRSSIALFTSQASRVVGMTLYLGSLALAEVVSPADEVVMVAMDSDEHKALMVELFICQECFIKPINLALLTENRAEIIQSKNRG